MPAYVAGKAQAIYPGDQVLAYSAEQPATGTASTAFAVGPIVGNDVPAISVEVQFVAAPGAFEFDIQEADVDVAADYVTIPTAGVINAVNGAFHARVDLNPFMGAFVRINTVTQNANATNATVRITRKA